MNCLLCHQKISRFRQWRTGSEFCCDEHAESYKNQMLDRLLVDTPGPKKEPQREAAEATEATAHVAAETLTEAPAASGQDDVGAPVSLASPGNEELQQGEAGDQETADLGWKRGDAPTPPEAARPGLSRDPRQQTADEALAALRQIADDARQVKGKEDKAPAARESAKLRETDAPQPHGGAHSDSAEDVLGELRQLAERGSPEGDDPDFTTDQASDDGPDSLQRSSALDRLLEESAHGLPDTPWEALPLEPSGSQQAADRDPDTAETAARPVEPSTDQTPAAAEAARSENAISVSERLTEEAVPEEDELALERLQAEVTELDEPESGDREGDREPPEALRRLEELAARTDEPEEIGREEPELEETLVPPADESVPDREAGERESEPPARVAEEPSPVAELNQKVVAFPDSSQGHRQRRSKKKPAPATEQTADGAAQEARPAAAKRKRSAKAARPAATPPAAPKVDLGGLCAMEPAPRAMQAASWDSFLTALELDRDLLRDLRGAFDPAAELRHPNRPSAVFQKSGAGSASALFDVTPRMRMGAVKGIPAPEVELASGDLSRREPPDLASMTSGAAPPTVGPVETMITSAASPATPDTQIEAPSRAQKAIEPEGELRAPAALASPALRENPVPDRLAAVEELLAAEPSAILRLADAAAALIGDRSERPDGRRAEILRASFGGPAIPSSLPGAGAVLSPDRPIFCSDELIAAEPTCREPGESVAEPHRTQKQGRHDRSAELLGRDRAGLFEPIFETKQPWDQDPSDQA